MIARAAQGFSETCAIGFGVLLAVACTSRFEHAAEAAYNPTFETSFSCDGTECAIPSMRPPYKLTAPDWSCLVRTLFGEVRGQGEAEVKAVVGVIKTRRASGQWGHTICDVVHAPRQFSAYNRGDPNRRAMYSRGVEQSAEWQRLADIAWNSLSADDQGYSHYVHPRLLRKLYGKDRPAWWRGCGSERRIGDGLFCRMASNAK